MCVLGKRDGHVGKLGRKIASTMSDDASREAHQNATVNSGQSQVGISYEADYKEPYKDDGRIVNNINVDRLQSSCSVTSAP